MQARPKGPPSNIARVFNFNPSYLLEVEIIAKWALALGFILDSSESFTIEIRPKGPRFDMTSVFDISPAILHEVEIVEVGCKLEIPTSESCFLIGCAL